MKFNEFLQIGLAVTTLSTIVLLFLYSRTKKTCTCDETPKLIEKPPQFLQTIKKHYSETEEHNYVSIAKPPGDIVLAWREWSINGYKNRALDVLFINENGKVETLGTCVENEVFDSLTKIN